MLFFKTGRFDILQKVENMSYFDAKTGVPMGFIVLLCTVL